MVIVFQSDSCVSATRCFCQTKLNCVRLRRCAYAIFVRSKYDLLYIGVLTFAQFRAVLLATHSRPHRFVHVWQLSSIDFRTVAKQRCLITFRSACAPWIRISHKSCFRSAPFVASPAKTTPKQCTTLLANLSGLLEEWELPNCCPGGRVGASPRCPNVK